MSRGDYTQSSTYGYNSGRGGTHSGSVYQRQDQRTGIPTGPGGYNYQSPYGGDDRPQGAGAVGQGSNNQQFDEDAYNRQTAAENANTGFWLPDRPTSFGDAWDNTVEWSVNKLQSMPIVRIGGSILDGSLIDDAGKWLGGWADSPWNPMNWESGDPPQWTVELGDGTVVGRGSAADGLDTGLLYGSGGSSLGEQASRSQVGDTLTTSGGGTVTLGGRNVKQEGDEGYIKYNNNPDNPEGMYIPAGSFFNHRTQQIESIQGDPYAYRRIDASNAWNRAGLNDLVVSDEEWSQMSEEERQENFEARREASKDFYNFGNQGANPSPFIDILPAQNFQGSTDEWAEGVRELYNNGEITSQQLDRFLDDAKRNQGEATVEQLEVAERLDFLKDVGGYEDEELVGFIDEFAKEEFSSTGARSKDDYFDTFQNTVQELTNVDPALEESMYELYDTKRDEDYTNSFNYLDSVRGTEDFNLAYSNTDVTKRNAYLEHMYGKGELTDEEYGLSVAANLASDGEFVFQLDDGRFAVGTEEGVYADHTIILMPDAELPDDQKYYDYEKNKKFDDVTSVEGASDEFNDRRKRIARLDNTGGVRYKNAKALKKPEGSFFDKVKNIGKTVGLNVLTGGAYSAVPALENIVKGEATTEDWAVFAVPALEATGLIVPPSGVKGDVGRGLEIGKLQLSYANTVLGVEAILADDFESFFKNKIASPYIEGKLREIDWELPKSVQEGADDWQAYWDTVPDDIKAGIDKTVLELRKGKSFDEAATKGVIEWAEESGIGNRIEDSLKDAASNFDDEFLQPFKDKITNIVNVDGAKKFLSNFDDEALQNFTKPIGDAGSMIEDVVRETGSAIDDAVIEPTKEYVEDTGSMIEDVVRDAGSAVDDAVIEPVKEFVENIEVPDIDIDLPSLDIDLPSVDLPSLDIDLPSVDLPSFDLPSIGLPSLGLGLAMGGGTRTTDSLFGRELFKFKDRDFSLVELLTEDMPKENPEEENLYDFNDDPFASTFDRNV